MVTPDGEVGNGGDGDLGFEGELGLGAVFVEASHGEPAIRWDVFGMVTRNKAIRITGIADDEYADIGCGIVLDGFALGYEDVAVDGEEVAALHAGFARDTANEDGPVGGTKAFVKIGSRDDTVEQGEGAVF